MTARPTHPIVLLLVALALVAGACGGDDGDAATTPADSTTTTDGAADDDASGTSEAAYVDAAAVELATPSDGIALPGESAECMAQALVDIAGADRLAEAEISPERFATADSFDALDLEVADGDAQRLATAMDECIDFRALLADTAPADFGCLVEGVDETEVARALADEWITGTPADLTSLMFESADPACAEQVFLASGVQSGDIDEAQAGCVADALDDEVAARILLTTTTGQGPSEADSAAVQAAIAQCSPER